MVAKNIVEAEQEIEEPPKRIVLSARDAEAFLSAIEGPPKVNPNLAEMIRKDNEFRKRHHVEVVR